MLRREGRLDNPSPEPPAARRRSTVRSGPIRSWELPALAVVFLLLLALGSVLGINHVITLIPGG